MRFTAFIAFYVFFTSNIQAQLQPYNKAMVWRGFKHQWTYNHRCNRIGDFVMYNDSKPFSTHASATGLGPDSTYFTSYYTYLQSPDVAFKEGKVSIQVQSREKQLVEGDINVNLDADEWLKNKMFYKTLLNGFDLSSETAADKIQLLKLNITDGVYDSASETVKFRINFSMVLNCQSVECSETTNKVDYNLDVYYLIAAYNEPDAMATEKFIPRAYSWDRKEPLNENPRQNTIKGSSMGNYGAATLGIKGFSVTLNEAHWLVQLANNVQQLAYDSATATIKFDMGLLFKEWQEGMRESGAAPGKSKFAEKRKGWVVMEADVVLLQMKQADMLYQSRDGRMFWKGSNTKPTGHDAVNSIDLSISNREE